MDFNNKVIIITGASSGIGRGAAEYLSQHGAQLVLVGRNEENLKETSAKCSSKTLIVVADITKENDRENIIKQTLLRFGKIDVLVNNAGLGKFGDVQTMDMIEYDKIMDINVRSVFHLTQLAIPHLVKTQGNIVNVSSLAGIRAAPGATAYCMSKAALDQFTRCLALELAPKNVRVNAINPAVIVTNFQREAGLSEKAYGEFIERAKLTHPLGRVGDVSETAHAIAFLASDLATFITGTCLPVDGGKAQLCPR